MSDPASGAGHPSRFAFSRRLAGDLEPAERASFDAHLASCPRCAGLYREAEESARGFAAKYPTPEYLAATRRARRDAPRGEPTGFWSRLVSTVTLAGGYRSALAGLVVLAAAGALVWLGQVDRSGSDLTPKGKGEASFYLFVNGRQAGAEAVEARPGDTLQLGITAPSRVRYAVLYRDDERPLAAYMEPAPGRAAGGAKGENLPNSLVLDADWDRSVLYCVTSDRPFTLGQAEAAIGRMGEGVREAVEEGLRIQTFLLRNAAR